MKYWRETIHTTGEAGGPDLMKTMEVVGTQEVKKRIDQAIVIFNQSINHG